MRNLGVGPEIPLERASCILTTERVGGTLILVVSGRVEADDADALWHRVTREIGDADTAVILDFGNVSYCSRAALRAVMLLAREMEWRGGRCAVCTLGEKLDAMFRMTGFDQVVQVHDSRAAAVAALGAPAPGASGPWTVPWKPG